MDAFPDVTPHNGSSFTTTPTISRYQFGDGYSQRVTNGINSLPRSWSVQWSDLSASVANTITDFLISKKGTEAFTWTPPRGAAGIWSCSSWTDTQHNNLVDIQATFTEEFDQE